MNQELIRSVFVDAPEFDMTKQAEKPYRLTLAERDALPLAEGQLEARQAIRRIELFMKSPEADEKFAEMGLERLDCADPVMLSHHFTAGIYIREFRMKKGSIVISKLHAQEHWCIISAGAAIVVSEDGRQLIEAPCSFKSPAGSKRALYILADMTWSTIHRSDETEIEKLEAELIIPEPDDYLALKEAV